MKSDEMDARLRAQCEKAKSRFYGQHKKIGPVTEKAAAAGVPPVDTDERTQTRRGVIDHRDGLGLERIIGGKVNFFHTNYFEQARAAVKAICRIHILNPMGIPLGFGTGFLVAPGLIMTNNHVLEGPEAALRSIAEFDFEYDANFQPKSTESFALAPNDIFWTDKDLDVTFIAVASSNGSGTSIDQFGMLPLIAESGKALVNEPVSIIQHPEGGLKRVALRDSKIMGIPAAPDDDFIHYTTDTEPGSSGSPVLNDQWQVVALHHAGVRGEHGGWVANEGVRVSRIWRKIENSKTRQAELIGQKLVLAKKNMTSDVGTHVSRSDGQTMEAAPFPVRRWSDQDGYKEDFLDQGVIVPFPMPHCDDDDVRKTQNDRDLFRYTHFSIGLSKSRRLAFAAGVNIDGADMVGIRRGSDSWRLDARTDATHQIDNDAYKRNDFDRGHLVRRISPNWGDETIAKRANDDTFHYTNCAPQHKNLNQRIWLDLENYILDTAKSDGGGRVSVFTGPVFRADDRLYRDEYLIPADYWKVACALDGRGRLRAAAYLQTQKDLVDDVREAAFGDYKTYRVPVSLIAELTGLDFGPLVGADRRSGREATRQRSVISGKSDIDLF